MLKYSVLLMAVDECVMMLIIKIFQEILEKWMEKWFLMDYLWKKMERNGCRFLYQFKTNVETLHATSLQGFAERARFELAEEFPLRQFSKLVVSATHPPLRGFISEIGGKNTLFFDMPMASTKKNFDVDFDIGFWLFPIFLNELKNQ